MRIPKRARAPKLGTSVEQALGQIAEMSPQSYDYLAEPAVEVGQLVRQARLEAGRTQTDLAQATGLPQSAISAMERGVGVDGPTYRKLREIGKALGLRLIYSPIPETAAAASESMQADFTSMPKGHSVRTRSSASKDKGLKTDIDDDTTPRSESVEEWSLKDETEAAEAEPDENGRLVAEK